MSKKVILIICVIVLILGGIVIIPKFALFLASRKGSINEESKAFFIRSLTSIDSLTKDLQSEGIIDDPDAFLSVAEYKGMNASNVALGKYIIEPGTSYKTILNGFRLNDAGNGNAEVEVEVVLNNFKDIRELAGGISRNILIDSATFVKIIESPNTLKLYGMSQEEIPALFLPNTYKMYFDTDEEQFIKRMFVEYRRFWSNERLAKLKKVGLGKPSEAVTLASIVYSEQGRVAEEWPVIAGLYLNRMKRGIKLQSDPTFKFCWGDKLDGVQRLLNVHRDIDCPYNTYKIIGLPPGPICIPPTEVVDAVLNRDDNDFIFMMAKPDYSGKHDFTVEYKDHERLAKTYQNWLANEIR